MKPPFFLLKPFLIAAQRTTSVADNGSLMRQHVGKIEGVYKIGEVIIRARNWFPIILPVVKSLGAQLPCRMNTNRNLNEYVDLFD